MATERALSPPTKREADALLTSLKMAERHKHWKMVESILNYIKASEARFFYLDSGTYALQLH